MTTTGSVNWLQGVTSSPKVNKLRIHHRNSPSPWYAQEVNNMRHPIVSRSFRHDRSLFQFNKVRIGLRGLLSFLMWWYFKRYESKRQWPVERIGKGGAGKRQARSQPIPTQQQTREEKTYISHGFFGPRTHWDRGARAGRIRSRQVWHCTCSVNAWTAPGGQVPNFSRSMWDTHPPKNEKPSPGLFPKTNRPEAKEGTNVVRKE